MTIHTWIVCAHGVRELTALPAFTPLQRRILEALADGFPIKTKPLVLRLKIDKSRLYKPNGIRELLASGMVASHPALGYYRPDRAKPALWVNG